MRFFFCLCLLLLGWAAPSAHAFSRSYQPIGDYLRSSPLVIIADIATEKEPRFEIVLTVREVLKQDEPATIVPGARIALPPLSAMWIVPREAQDVAVIMAPDWDAEGNRSRAVSEVYQEPAQIAAVRALIEVYRAPGERARLTQLSALSGQGNRFLDEQLLADLSRIRERDNFDIVLESYARLPENEQIKLLELLGTIGDARALPLLIGALDAPSIKVSRNAIAVLTRRFPDAPGVNEALRAYLDDADRRPLVLGYLSQRDPTLAVAVATTITPTTWMRAEKARDNGDINAARTLYFSMLDADAELGWATLSASRELLKLALTEADKTRLRQWLVARLTSDKPYLPNAELDRQLLALALTEADKTRWRQWLEAHWNADRPNYSDAGQALELLRALPDAGNVPALTRYLALPGEPSNSLWEQPARTATFALRELGAQARATATASVVQTLKSRFAPGANSSSQQATVYGCELAWLADDATWKNAAQISPIIARELAALQPLRDAATSTHEARALAALLPDSENRLQNNADHWIIQRLGELGDAVAVAPLLAELKRAPYAGRDLDFKRALLAIGGDAARDGALQLLDYPEYSQRALGMDVLRELPDYDVRPLLLKILDGTDDSDANKSDKTHAIFLLGYIGTPQDLPRLGQLADFWTTDLAYQSRALEAITGIRLRFPSAK